ncbi:MAG: hypothetical protein OEZ14_02485 [Acidimicrobiia bacterium]|nr:hypothetical protein [Acidimicrobiia bacterium]MDH5519379.1 hypothetical protein [Acidimicrobiia bacterium]
MNPNIDYDVLPVDRPDSAAYAAAVDRVRAELAHDGCAVLHGVLTPTGLAAAVAEADDVAPTAHRSFNRTNPYFTIDDESLPADDPRRRFYDRSNAFVPADNLLPGGPLRGIYDEPGFDRFIQDCLQAESFHRYADPLADVIINTAVAGPGFPWHFDTNDYTVTLAIQTAEEGGAFEYAPNIRSADDENFAEVSQVLDGVSDRVVTLDLTPGDLQIFLGRHSLHRVTPLLGDRPRHVGIFSYVDEPDMVASPERCRQLYGRVLPVHFERAGRRHDILLD